MSLQRLRAADEISEELCINVQAALVLHQISFAVSAKENLNACCIRAQRMHKRLENGDTVDDLGGGNGLIVKLDFCGLKDTACQAPRVRKIPWAVGQHPDHRDIL